MSHVALSDVAHDKGHILLPVGLGIHAEPFLEIFFIIGGGGEAHVPRYS